MHEIQLLRMKMLKFIMFGLYSAVIGQSSTCHQSVVGLSSSFDSQSSFIVVHCQLSLSFISLTSVCHHPLSVCRHPGEAMAMAALTWVAIVVAAARVAAATVV